MIGANSFSGGPDSLSFRFKAKAKNKAKAIVITLNGRDLYDVRFVAIRGFEAVDVGRVEDIYCDMLKAEIEDATGLMLSL